MGCSLVALGCGQEEGLVVKGITSYVPFVRTGDAPRCSAIKKYGDQNFSVRKDLKKAAK